MEQQGQEEKKTPEIALSQVWQKKNVGRSSKVVITERNIEAIKADIEQYEYVCAKPHDDHDFSYLCPRNWCRCSD